MGEMTLVWRHLPRPLCLVTSTLRILEMRPFLSLGASWTSVTKLGLHTRPRMPPCDFTPEKYQSLGYNRVLEIHKEHLSPVVTALFQKPLLLHQGHMEWLFDAEGNRYLDFFSGIVTVSVGHCHPTVNAAAQKQLGRLWHTSAVFFHAPIHEYAEKLAALLPEPLKVIFLVNSGSEANDLAMLMARAHSNNIDIISFSLPGFSLLSYSVDQELDPIFLLFLLCRGAYHGCSPYTLGLTNVGTYKMELPGGIGCQSTMCPDVFRGPWGGSHCRDSPVQTIRKCSCAPDCCQAKDQYIEQFKDTLSTSVANSIAGFFAEPIQGVNGVVQYPKGFLKEAFELVRARGGVCIADETSRQPLPREEVNQIHEDCKNMGLLVGKGGIFAQTFRIAPPMCITKLEADFAVEVFRSALTQHMERRAK
ncbi:alanine--glyoxylate aminotransferase 2, mitochondrial isoform X7 [Sapajus apella]|uniref:Alanine--glyoxylate aminotransferase 2, mitochondrial n=1 Tax=Sapajus apella TaxID=9515 RepID=A0A6J3HYY4_SAPAP|nr:alanine--glyoxylate aminotransferase 2, mitochondrial isoform X7 [Sapajus apella]